MNRNIVLSSAEILLMKDLLEKGTYADHIESLTASRILTKINDAVKFGEAAHFNWNYVSEVGNPEEPGAMIVAVYDSLKSENYVIVDEDTAFECGKWYIRGAAHPCLTVYAWAKMPETPERR